jgi:hypothetical protein
MLIWTSSPLSLDTSSSCCLRVACAPSSARSLLLELTQRLLPRQALPLERGPSLGESSLLLLELGLRLLARRPFLMELLLHRDERVGLAR